MDSAELAGRTLAALLRGCQSIHDWDAEEDRAVSSRTLDLRCLHARHAKEALRFRAGIGPCSGRMSRASTESCCGTNGRADMLVMQEVVALVKRKS